MKRPLRRSKLRLKNNNIKIDVKYHIRMWTEFNYRIKKKLAEVLTAYQRLRPVQSVRYSVDFTLQMVTSSVHSTI